MCLHAGETWRSTRNPALNLKQNSYHVAGFSFTQGCEVVEYKTEHYRNKYINKILNSKDRIKDFQIPNRLFSDNITK